MSGRPGADHLLLPDQEKADPRKIPLLRRAGDEGQLPCKKSCPAREKGTVGIKSSLKFRNCGVRRRNPETAASQKAPTRWRPSEKSWLESWSGAGEPRTLRIMRKTARFGRAFFMASIN